MLQKKRNLTKEEIDEIFTSITKKSLKDGRKEELLESSKLFYEDYDSFLKEINIAVQNNKLYDFVEDFFNNSIYYMAAHFNMSTYNRDLENEIDFLQKLPGNFKIFFSKAIKKIAFEINENKSKKIIRFVFNKFYFKELIQNLICFDSDFWLSVKIDFKKQNNNLTKKLSYLLIENTDFLTKKDYNLLEYGIVQSADMLENDLFIYLLNYNFKINLEKKYLLKKLKKSCTNYCHDLKKDIFCSYTYEQILKKDISHNTEKYKLVFN